MGHEFDDKIVNLFGDKSKVEKLPDEATKFFAGFEYIRLDRDSNGNPFIEQNLLDYANTCHYIVRIMRKKGKRVFLYNYEVPSEKLYEFLEKFYKNELTGTIIEIDKYIPDDLA